VLGKLQIYAKVCSLYLLQEFALLFQRFGTQVEAVAITRAGFCSRLQHAVNACVRKERWTKKKWAADISRDKRDGLASFTYHDYTSLCPYLWALPLRWRWRLGCTVFL